MVNSITLKGEPTKLIPLKNRRRDFERIMRLDEPMPSTRTGDGHFISRCFLMRFAKTRFPNRNIHLGITTSKKSTSKLAHDRNRARRRIRYAMNGLARKYDIIGWDIIIIARRAILDCEYKALEKELGEALAHLEKIKRRHKHKIGG
jgi:ribonuclease P protein component